VRVLDALNHAGQSFNEQSGDAPVIIRLGALTTAAMGMLPRILDRFHQLQPNTTIQVATLHNNVLLAGLRGGEFDIGIGRM
ncbi:LysR substrate-binding domain-containing protein, partial [Klebsiella pneumoniae]